MRRRQGAYCPVMKMRDKLTPYRHITHIPKPSSGHLLPASPVATQGRGAALLAKRPAITKLWLQQAP